MPHEGKCRFCQNTWVQWHHIIEKGMGRSKKVTWLDYSLNLVEVCQDDHTGLTGIHTSDIGTIRGKELEAELQAKLEHLFFKDYYNPLIIKKLLKYTDKQLRDMTKTLQFYDAGYKREDIILRLMGRK